MPILKPAYVAYAIPNSPVIGPITLFEVMLFTFH